MSRATKITTALAVASIVGLTLAGCSGSPATGTSGEAAPNMTEVAAAASDGAAPATEAAKTTFTFGETATFDGLTLAISAPEAFTPSQYAYTGSQPSNVKFTVTITNTGTEGYDPSLTFITASSASQEAEQIIDTEGGLALGPSTTILPGASVSYPVGFNVADPAQVVMDVTSGFDYEKTTWTN
ncbi:hypothetical protein ITJ55_00210 [Frigoribacterium sp. VKM Ac-1396]|uniref:hypothetical protein n=1 Tax=Frigoribacterium sp. VKM Ac-1396 TaxID=2783821 RepID=UPI00188CDE38|nr:hypothetical protein [Frigoribacterium sp. VKM Ac-1396]MBF4599224.1 hypothetical protein [Frigoribacterium sp. VKM Ac-1396]